MKRRLLVISSAICLAGALFAPAAQATSTPPGTPAPTPTPAPNQFQIVSRMPEGIGFNFWNIMWDGTDDYFKPRGQVNWATTTDPWNPQFLQDLKGFKGALRFMDWDTANLNPIVHWQHRAVKTANHHDYAYYPNGLTIPMEPEVRPYFGPGGDGYISPTTYKVWPVAYEWMIDLCNRTNHDLWITVPTFADDNYVLELAKLINTQLKPELKVYAEYSNETWNPSFITHHYHVDKAAQMGLPGENKWYAGAAYSVLRSVQIFQIFQNVIGKENTGVDKRLVRVLSSGGNYFYPTGEGIRNIIYDGTKTTKDTKDFSKVPFNSKFNPGGQVPDVFAIAPYVGAGIADGAAPGAFQQFRFNEMQTTINHISEARGGVLSRYHYPLVTYEGGQHLYQKNVDTFNQNPAIYDEYINYLNVWKDQGVLMFMHYTLYGSWSNSSAWGAKEHGNSPHARSYKFKALQDWQNANVSKPDIPCTLIRGADRTATALQIANQKEFNNATAAVIVAGGSPIDGVIAAPLAIANQAPVLYGDNADIGDSNVQWVKDKHIKKLLIVGAGRVAPATRQALEAAGVSFEVIVGRDRFDTAVKVAANTPNASNAYVADGLDLPDPMAAAVAAGQNNGVVLLTNRANPANPATTTQQFLADHPALTVHAVGGPAAQAMPNAANKIIGSDRYFTAIQLAKTYVKTSNAPVVSTAGASLIDAVPAAVLAARKGAALVYVLPRGTVAEAVDQLKTATGHACGEIFFIGRKA